MASSSATVSVIIASAQSVAKVYVIGAAGFFAVKYPRNAPFLPAETVGTVARFSFHILLLPLIYGTTAMSVTPESIGDYWFVIAGAFVVMLSSYVTATALHHFCIPISNERDFCALRIAATFPNIVALPILIFPSLCEYEVVYKGYAVPHIGPSGEELFVESSVLQEECIARSNTMIFCYFFSWSLAFWTFGCPQLLAAAQMNMTQQQDEKKQEKVCAQNSQQNSIEKGNDDELRDSSSAVVPFGGACEDDEAHEIGVKIRVEGNNEGSENDNSNLTNLNHALIAGTQHVPPSTNYDGEDDDDDAETRTNAESVVTATKGAAGEATLTAGDQTTQQTSTKLQLFMAQIKGALIQTFTSPGFLALLFGFLTGCIRPLQAALFQPGGALRFLGSSIETMGIASSPVSTMIVAASLVPAGSMATTKRDDDERPTDDHDGNLPNNNRNNGDDNDESPIMSDPSHGPRQARFWQRRRRETQKLRELGQAMMDRSSGILSRAVHKQRKEDDGEEDESSNEYLQRQEKKRSTTEIRRLLLWYVLSRLILAPAVVVGVIVAFDCGGGNLLSNVPDLAKLVIIVNSCVPGAQIIVVVLKSRPELSDSAAAVAKIYLPSYLLSIVTIAAWTAVGLYVTLPDESGRTICERMQ